MDVESEGILLNKRNIGALNEAMKHDRLRLDELAQKIYGLQRSLTTVQQDLFELRAQLAAIANMR